MQVKPFSWWVKQFFRAMFYGLIILIALVFLWEGLYDYTRRCHRLPFQAFFSKYGFTTCGEIVKIKLVSEVRINGTPQEMEFHIPTEYLEKPKFGVSITDEIKLFLAYPSFKPWFMVADRAEGKESVYPIEITLRMNDRVNKRYEPARGSEVFVFHHKKIGMDLYKFRNPESVWEEMCPTSYYYPHDITTPIKDMPIEYMSCPSLCWPRHVLCRPRVVYSKHLYGEYTFRHRSLDDFPEIDREVRKLVEKFIAPTAGREQVYFVNFNKEK